MMETLLRLIVEAESAAERSAMAQAVQAELSRVQRTNGVLFLILAALVVAGGVAFGHLYERVRKLEKTGKLSNVS